MSITIREPVAIVMTLGRLFTPAQRNRWKRESPAEKQIESYKGPNRYFGCHDGLIQTTCQRAKKKPCDQ